MGIRDHTLKVFSLKCWEKKGPDNITMAFWHLCWDFTKAEIMEVFEDFFCLGTFQRSLNSTFLVLIPEKRGCRRVERLQTDQSGWGLHKLLAKVLANRLKSVVGVLVSDNQHAFIQGRQILDATLIANEVVDSREALSQLLSRASCGGFVEGFKMGRSNGEGRDLLHLLFVDDTLIFCNTNSENLIYLSWVFLWFEAISGLKVNRDKSEVIPVGRIKSLEDVVSMMGCRVRKLPTSYLGLPLGAFFKSSRVCARLEKIQRDFLWGGSALEKKPHLVNWSLVYTDKKEGGLGIRRLVALNKALLGKWSWRFAIERESFWKQVIINKFGLEKGGWCSSSKERLWCGVWKAIRKEWEGIRCRSHFIVENGREVKFWKDMWCEDQTLKEVFPNLYQLAVNKDEWVSNAWEGSGESGSWNPHFSRHFNDWELEEVEGLLWKLHPLVVRREVEDVLSWKESRDGIFSVRSLYRSFTRTYSDPFP
ncbi:putative ribonuclease H protein [Vitis vinifera]|uniref:Putative ribonuclease H protein n=1 Tax=Vitis vinifera TaxID=29760 RepID=A0A438BP56_VITVI|nr:putative ribonuclease H protein [Vitis vinifera]